MGLSLRNCTSAGVLSLGGRSVIGYKCCWPGSPSRNPSTSPGLKESARPDRIRIALKAHLVGRTRVTGTRLGHERSKNNWEHRFGGVQLRALSR